uniref:Uncharacterized protein n=1 Tax=Aplanochytrium stocchinoi TaxID=215587 RepID=A0A7S3V194_9STRA|mmetsp:Transcript_17694/g.22547  ORF Transcript_17694/g.22547 Transcript_17694/m.22547 type:complete len:366 (-) Transcript_17694:96-1193(-)
MATKVDIDTEGQIGKESELVEEAFPVSDDAAVHDGVALSDNVRSEFGCCFHTSAVVVILFMFGTGWLYTWIFEVLAVIFLIQARCKDNMDYSDPGRDVSEIQSLYNGCLFLFLGAVIFQVVRYILYVNNIVEIGSVITGVISSNILLTIAAMAFVYRYKVNVFVPEVSHDVVATVLADGSITDSFLEDHRKRAYFLRCLSVLNIISAWGAIVFGGLPCLILNLILVNHTVGWINRNGGFDLERYNKKRALQRSFGLFTAIASLTAMCTVLCLNSVFFPFLCSNFRFYDDFWQNSTYILNNTGQYTQFEYEVSALEHNIEQCTSFFVSNLIASFLAFAQCCIAVNMCWRTRKMANSMNLNKLCCQC